MWVAGDKTGILTMNNLSQNQSIKILNSPEEYKIQASKLLKILKNTDSPDPSAIARLSRSPECLNFFKNNQLQLKHVLNLLAQEQGFKTWEALKKSAEIAIQQLFNNYSGGGFLNHWFSNYSDAQQYQNNHGGYLLPYKNQFFICDADYIINLGFGK